MKAVDSLTDVQAIMLYRGDCVLGLGDRVRSQWVGVVSCAPLEKILGLLSQRVCMQEYVSLIVLAVDNNRTFIWSNEKNVTHV